MMPTITLQDDHGQDGARQKVVATVNGVGGLRIRSRTMSTSGVSSWTQDYSMDQTEEVLTLLAGEAGDHVLDVIAARQADHTLPVPLHRWLDDQGLTATIGVSEGW